MGLERRVCVDCGDDVLVAMKPPDVGCGDDTVPSTIAGVELSTPFAHIESRFFIVGDATVIIRCG